MSQSQYAHEDPNIHLHMLRMAAQCGGRFDTVQMPLNLMDAHYRSFAQQVLPELVGENIGVLGMKSRANGILLRSNTVTAMECLQYALNLPTSVVITGIGSMGMLDQACRAALTFRPMGKEEDAGAPGSKDRDKRAAAALPGLGDIDRNAWLLALCNHPTV